MRYDIVRTSKFKRDYKRIKAQGKELSKLAKVIELFANGEPLSNEYSGHSLKGNWVGYRECQIEPNWLLILKSRKSYWFCH